LTVSQAAFILLGVLTLALLVGRRAFVVVTVVGGSMEPTLRSGDRVLATRWFWRSALRRGDIVLLRGDLELDDSLWAEHGQPMMIKRLAHQAGDSIELGQGELLTLGPTQVFVRADNPDAADSRVWGPIPVRTIAGVVLARLNGETGSRRATELLPSISPPGRSPDGEHLVPAGPGGRHAPLALIRRTSINAVHPGRSFDEGPSGPQPPLDCKEEGHGYRSVAD
jgi:signal peptidase I